MTDARRDLRPQLIASNSADCPAAADHLWIECTVSRICSILEKKRRRCQESDPSACNGKRSAVPHKPE
jgi:hypothetical protein